MGENDNEPPDQTDNFFHFLGSAMYTVVILFVVLFNVKSIVELNFSDIELTRRQRT